jgi:hypothetical protein
MMIEKELRTSNELTPIYGYSPLEKRGSVNDSAFKRGIVIYIGGFSPKVGNERMINPRMVYYDFVPNGLGIKNQDDLELQVLIYGRSGLLKMDDIDNNVPDDKKRGFPYVFDDNINQIHFGSKPCIVSYILDVDYLEFQTPCVEEGEKSLNQPVVFRRNKVIVSDQNQTTIDEYEENACLCFSNLIHKHVESASTLRFYNNMIDPSGEVLNSRDDGPYRYCMDMYIRTEMGRKLQSPMAQATTLGAESNWLTMVFDPPQENGGGHGPG